MASGEGVTVPADRKPRRVGSMLRSQMRNIAPFLTLICLFSFFAAASPSFATLDNFGNILTQISITGIIAVGLTFVILCAEIDLSIAAIANVTGIAVAYFTAQESYVNIANIPMPGWMAIVLALALCASLGLVNAFGVTVIGIPDAYRGEAPKAFIKLKAGASATADDIRKHLEPKISKIEMPAEIEFRDALPKTMIGKLSKKELKAEEASRQRAS